MQTHTILGSKSQRGLTQLAMDVLFRSIGPNMLDAATLPSTLDSLQSCDASEGSLSPANQYLETVFAPENHLFMSRSRAATPLNVGPPTPSSPPLDNYSFSFVNSRIRVYSQDKLLPGAFPGSPSSERDSIFVDQESQ